MCLLMSILLLTSLQQLLSLLVINNCHADEINEHLEQKTKAARVETKMLRKNVSKIKVIHWNINRRYSQPGKTMDEFIKEDKLIKLEETFEKLIFGGNCCALLANFFLPCMIFSMKSEGHSFISVRKV